jgi:RNA 2',3'-cyclic 3'-phosphodiesterase
VTESHTLPESSAKVFFAIWPDAAALKELSKLAGQLVDFCGGRKTRSPMIHLTLAFIGNVDSHRLEMLRQVANEVKQRSFDLIVDEIQYWQHNHIIHVGPNQCPAGLHALVSDLHNRLSDAGFQLEKRRYIPHITLVRKAMCTTLPDLMTSITWHVNEWALVQSKQTDQGIVYVSLDRWSLG